MILQNTKTSNGFCSSLVEVAEFPHPVSKRELIETHISCVILTGEFAYKVKKAVDLGFVDYSTIERRKHFCELEVELNRRFAPDIYLGVAPLYRTGNAVCFAGTDQELPPEAEIIDYAVKMKEFEQDTIVAARINHADLTPDSVEAFGRDLAKRHDEMEYAIPTVSYVQPSAITKDALDNFQVLVDPLTGDFRFGLLEKLGSWTTEQAANLQLKFADRLNRGLVRRCHGDLHLKNVIQIDGTLIPFDGIEFNERFQWIDVLSELAFPAMDFFARGRADLGWRLINAYMEATDNYFDLDVLRFYLVYRAMVRAKVAWLNPRNHTESRRTEYATADHPQDQFAGPWDKYLATANYFAFELIPKLSITHGYSGSGKSTVAIKIIEAEGGVRIRSDAMRHQLATQFQVSDKYSTEMGEWIYSRLLQLARTGVTAGFSIIIDATFLKIDRRQLFFELASELDVPYEIVDCDAPFGELCRRLRSRHDDPSEADIAVLNLQLQDHEPLTKEERKLKKNYEGLIKTPHYKNSHLGQRRS